jgi:hypothetical protein
MTNIMIENLLYVIVGFVATYLSLEVAWHFTACRIKDKRMKPCFFKGVKTIMVAPVQATTGDKP